MSDSLKVSIVIPAYNHARHLDMAIQSVLYQDYDNIELIVLDDGSTDNTPNILEKYAGQFYWESQANMGQAQTLNKGWGMSRGPILSYLSADDILRKNAVSTSVRYLEKYQRIVMTYCDFYLIDSHDLIIRSVKAPEFDYNQMVLAQSCPPGPGVFFRREAFMAAGGWNPQFKQIPDYEYWLRLGLCGDLMRIPIVLASFRVHAQSLTHAKADMSRAKEPVLAIEKYYGLEGVPASLRGKKNQALGNANLMTAQLHLRSGRYLLGYLYLKKSFLLFPAAFRRYRSIRRIVSGLLNRPVYKLIFLINAIRLKLSPPRANNNSFLP
jgi:glycosyltransferase involved in cell wall biosynthesis